MLLECFAATKWDGNICNVRKRKLRKTRLPEVELEKAW
jgi:hypothetical protein